MKCYLVTYWHRHGDSIWPIFTKDDAPAPTPDDVIATLPDFEPDRDDEGVYVSEAYDVPKGE